VLDLSGYANFAETVALHVRQSPARHFGITSTTPQLPAAVTIAEAIRAARPDGRIILGGPHITLTNAARKREERLGIAGRASRAYAKLVESFDVLVAGDGEETIFLACAPDAPALIDADDRRSPYFLNNEKLESTPYPARHLVDVESYKYTIDGEPALSVIGQLGCPFGCGFCAGRNSPMLRHIRRRSAQNIVDEISEIHRRWGHKGFMFYDDELNVDRGLVDLMRRLAVAQKAAGVEWRLRGFVKSELFNDEQAESMYAAGFRWLLVGFESGSSRILENINKKAAQADNTRCMDIARRHGLKVKALMSLGHPGESEQTAEETRRWLLDVKPADFDVTVITPYPGSPYYDDAIPTADPQVWQYSCANGDRLYQRELDYTQVADYYKGNPDDGYVSHVFTDHLSATDIVKSRDNLERDVRTRLGIPFNQSAAAVQYEHSMGQSSLPPRLLRTSFTAPDSNRLIA
jgi:anaerobic magnesium-protoporphyrin IX monomethyl ester cyclase